MKNITVLGIDIAKNVFALIGLDKQGNRIYRKKVTRKDFVKTVINLKAELVVMEACGGANHWYRTLTKLGIKVKLIAPQFVKPFVKSNKNDFNDAEAIAEAGSRGNMRFVSPKTLEQQDIQSLLRIRERLKKNRLEIMNQARGLLMEYGEFIPKGVKSFYERLAALIENDSEQITPIMQRALNKLYTELLNNDEEKLFYDKELTALYQQSEEAKRLSTIPGVGMYTSLGIISLVGDASDFKNGRHMAAYLGLVPRQHSSGGIEKLLGISKRGNIFVRSLLIQGAQSVLAQINRKTSNRNERLKALKGRVGHNKTAVAVANKNARMIWALLKHGTKYQEKLAWHGSILTNEEAISSIA